MNRILVTLLSLVMAGNLCSGKDKGLKTLATQTASAGIDLLHNTPLPAQQFIFPYEVHSWKYDSLASELVLLLKEGSGSMSVNRGMLVVFDLKGDTVRWEMPLSMFDLLLTKSSILMSNTSGTLCLSRADGSLQWKAENIRVRYVDEQHNIGLTGLGKAIDLTTGELRWAKKLSAEDYWDDFTRINDSMVAIASEGLYVINILTGSGNHVYGKTKKRNAQALSFGILGGVVGGMIGGAMIGVALSNSVREGLNSQVIVDGTKVYFAMLDAVVCIDVTPGKELWRVKLKAARSSTETLVLYGDWLALVNDGFIEDANGVKRASGKSSIALYDKATGTEIYSKDLSIYGALRDKLISGNELTFVYARNFAKLDITTGKEVLLTKSPAVQSFYEYFIDTSAVYFRSNTGYARFVDIYPDAAYLLANTRDSAVVLNRLGEPLAFRHFSEIARPINRHSAFTTLVHNTTYLLKDNKAVAELNKANKGFYHENKLYFFTKDKMNILKLTRFD